jgi:hypothetical protein
VNPLANAARYKIEGQPVDKATALSANLVVEGPQAEMMLAEMHDEEAADAEAGEDTLFPRTFDTLYSKVLKGIPRRRRPPDSFCDMCEGTAGMEAERDELAQMLGPPTQLVSGEEEEQQQELDFPGWRWGKYETRAKAQATYRDLKLKCARRHQHAIWLATQRFAVRGEGVCAQASF